MALAQGSLEGHRRRVDVLHHLYRVRISHRQHRDLDRGALDLERPTRADRPETARVEGHVFGIESRRAHVDANLPVGLQTRSDHPGKRFDADLGLLRESVVVHEPDEAARAVAAFLDLAAVCVPDAVAKIRVGALRFLDEENLIAADTEMPVRDPPRALRAYVKGSAEAVEHDEVVARPLHLGEFEAHLRAGTRRWPR